MKATTHIAKDLYIEGVYEFRDLEKTNWANPIDCPTILRASNSRKLNSGDWDSCTNLNTPRSFTEFAIDAEVISQHQTPYDITFPNITKSEKYEFVGLVYAIAQISEAWNAVKHGNHGTSAGADIRDETAANALLIALKKPVDRANKLLEQIRG